MKAGDTCEISTLRTVFEKGHSAANPLFVSSVKGSIGHCEAASGSAGLAKLLLMLRKNEIPIQANLKTLNPQLGDLEKGGIIVPRISSLWEPRASRPRRALLNNFGAAGSNAVLVLEERIKPKAVHTAIEDRTTYLFNLSAKTKEALEISVGQYQQFLKNGPTGSRLKDICYTATARRQPYDHRISIICSSPDDLQKKLGQANIIDSKSVTKSRPVVFIFSGQGSLYHGMGKDLLKTSSFFKATIMHCNIVLQELGFNSIIDYISGNLAPNSVLDVSDIITSQCACFALEYSVAQLLMSWNIIPDYVVGHRYVSSVICDVQ